ncbi:MAG: hypothetical protein KF841_14960 [Phycisphaerae bacterium]|nr:hypothetical protein [Phycisphaerae bacterium]
MPSKFDRFASPGLRVVPLFGLLAAAFVGIVGGCSHVNDPFKDSSASIDVELTTASAEGFKGKREFYSPLARRGETTVAYYENGAVTHWPLWFEDPFEDKGNDVTDPNDRDAPDTHFAWNWVDYLHTAYGPGRFFFVNGLLWPASAVVTPPGTLMESDGRIDRNFAGYDHDARRSDSASREPPDGNHLSPDSTLRISDGAEVEEPEAESTSTNSATTP